MFCSKCGKELDDEAIVCPGCGCQTHNYKSSNLQVNEKEDVIKKLDELKKCGYISIIGGLIIPIIGIVFGILGLSKLQNFFVPQCYLIEKSEVEKLNKIGIIISGIIILLVVVGFLVVYIDM